MFENIPKNEICKCFMRKETYSTNVLDLEDAHNVF